VRGYNETECNGKVWEKGHLQEYDLNWMVKGLPGFAKNWIRDYAKTESVIAYHFFYRSKDKKIDIGYVVTDTKHNLLKKWYVGSDKAASALDESVKYICN